MYPRINKTEQSKPAVKRPLALFCLAFSGAVFAGVYLLAGWALLLLGMLLLYFGLVCLFKRNWRWTLLLLGAVAGLWLSWVQTSSLRWLEWNWVGETAGLELQVRDFPQSTSYGVYVEVRVQTEGELKGVTLELWLPEGESLQPGDRLWAETALASAQDSDPNWRYYALSQGIRLAGRADWAELLEREVPWDLQPRLWARRLGEGLERCFSRETAGLLFALTTGDRTLLSDTLETELTETGLRHVVAASGLHVHLLFAALCLLPVGRRGRGILLLPLLLGFAALAGFTPSVCRAALMEGILLFGPLFDREADGMTSLSMALALLLGQNVYAAASVSLQLSFAAMFGLLVVCPALLRRCRGGTRWEVWRRIRKDLITTLGANVFTLPLVLYYFGTASLLAPVSNLVVLWLLPLLLPLGLLCGLTSWLCPAIGQLLAAPTGILTGLALEMIHTLAGFPWSTLGEGPPFLAWIVLCYGVGGILYVCRCSGRQTAAAILLLLVLLPAADWSAEAAEREVGLTAALLDVGQGQCLLLRSGGETAVVDCGGTGNRAVRKLEQALRWTGSDQIDCLILTHYDRDHAGGAAQLLLEGRVDQLCLPQPLPEDEAQAEHLMELARLLGVPVCLVSGEVTQGLGDASLRLLPVEQEDYRGLAVLTSVGEVDLLVTGDAGQAAEAELVEQWGLSQVEILVAGHHGSKYATGEALLEAAQPQAVLFSVGENSYGHPTQAVLDRCQAAGAELRRTDQNGTIWIQIWKMCADGGK